MNICTEDINLNDKIHNSKKQSSKTWMVGSLYKHNNRHLMSNNIQLSCKECNPWSLQPPSSKMGEYIAMYFHGDLRLSIVAAPGHPFRGSFRPGPARPALLHNGMWKCLSGHKSRRAWWLCTLPSYEETGAPAPPRLVSGERARSGRQRIVARKPCLSLLGRKTLEHITTYKPSSAQSNCLSENPYGILWDMVFDFN